MKSLKINCTETSISGQHASNKQQSMAAPRRSACHVHAPAVLLNGVLALWAILGVSHNPLRIPILVDGLSNPILYALAGDWLVFIFGTFKTPSHATVALNSRSLTWTACQVAADTRTPFPLSALRHEAVEQKPIIPANEFWPHAQFPHLRWPKSLSTFWSRTTQIQAAFTLCNRKRHVIRPTVFTITVATTWQAYVRRRLAEADTAKTGTFRTRLVSFALRNANTSADTVRIIEEHL